MSDKVELFGVRYAFCVCGKNYWLKDGPGYLRCGYCGSVYGEDEVILCRVYQPGDYYPGNMTYSKN